MKMGDGREIDYPNNIIRPVNLIHSRINLNQDFNEDRPVIVMKDPIYINTCLCECPRGKWIDI